MNSIWDAIRNTFTSIFNMIAEPLLSILIIMCIIGSIYSFITYDWYATITFILLELLAFQLYEIIQFDGSGK